MKKKRVMAIPICMIGIMLLGGCGAEPYVLTEQEEAVIVNYSASVVAKFNTYQKDGLTYLIAEDTETEEETQETEISVESETEEVAGTDASKGESGSETGTEVTEETGQQATMNEVFGAGGLDIVYTGNEIKDNYVEGNVYSVEADAGKSYLILNFDIANGSENDIELDNLTNAPVFEVTFTGEDGKGVKAAAYSTILLNDFSTYLDTIPAGETKQAVLLFKIPDTVTSADALKLQVELNQIKYEINL